MNRNFTKSPSKWVLSFQNGHQKLGAISVEQEDGSINTTAQTVGMSKGVMERVLSRWLSRDVLGVSDERVYRKRQI